jgi:hypothetical protein
MRHQGLTLGQFLSIIFDDKNQPYLMPNSKQNIALFLQGHTSKGTQPVDVVELMFTHPYG